MKTMLQTFLVVLLLAGAALAPRAAVAIRQAVCEAASNGQASPSAVSEAEFWAAACGR